MTLQLVECDEEDLVTNPSMFDVQSNNTRSPAKFDVQSNSSRTASMFDVQSNNSRAPSMFDVQSKGSQAQEQTEQAFAFLQDYDVTSQGTSEVASLGLSTTNLKSNNSRAPSMSDVQSKGSHVEEQTEQAFAFLEDYDVTSQGTSEVASLGLSTTNLKSNNSRAPSMSDVQSKGSHVEEQTEQAFAFLEDYDVTSQGTSEVTSLGLSNTNLMSIAEDSEHVTLSS
jgi:competence protein ComGC